VTADPQTEATGILQRLGPYTTLGPAFSTDGERPRYASPPPALGEHTGEVLAEAGYSPGEIADMAEADIIRLA
jgi:crotonobetainyl-CoA:carnitine CoA-transferase CaiB-like acyl-CoA transferase